MWIRLLRRCIALPAIGLIVTFHAASAPAASAIYRCELDGVITFSDRPCAADALEYVPDDQRVSTVKVEGISDSGQARPAARSKGRASSKGSIAADQLKLKEECARIDRSLSDIRSRMRAGYDAKEGERLKQRQRKLVLDRREKKCR